MNRVLMLAYHFPPIGGAGAQRSLKFARYLPSFGYRPRVVTGPGAIVGRWTPADVTLAGELPVETEVTRVPGPEPETPRWRGRAERWLWVPRTWDRWWLEGALAAGLRAGRVDLIYASMSPYSSADVAIQLAAQLGVPWVAGLRDPWALDEMTVYPSALHRRRELARMGSLLRTASGIVMSTPEAVLRVRQQFPELAQIPIVAIPNGFDAADFAGPAPKRDDEHFRIVHTGYLHTELGRQQRRTSRIRRLVGGDISGVDILTRSHVYLLEAIERLIEREPSLRERVELHLAGVLSSSDREVGERSALVRIHGYLPHADSIGLIRSADLLFLPMQNLPPGMRSSTVPGKTYEYLASRRPILAAVPPGDARDILARAGNAHICDPDDVDGMADAIRQEFERWASGAPPAEPAPEVIRRYERQHLTEELSAVLDAILEAPTPREAKASLADALREVEEKLLIGG